MTEPAVLITRTKVYPRPSRPGFAWHWVYTVTVPGEPHPFCGDRLSWARDIAKRKAPTFPVVLEWQRADNCSVTGGRS